MRSIISSICLGLLSLTSVAHAAILASGNSGNPSTVTQYNGSQGGGFTISEDVTYDPSAGPWVKQLVNSGGFGIASGNRVSISETFTNTGVDAWTDWHEQIISLTDIGGPQPGFLFDDSSLSVSVDDGGGFQLLIQGVDYTVVPTVFTGPGSGGGGGGGNDGWEALSILFSPSALIQTGDALRIEKQIFEVFLDGNIWQQGESAEIAQYATIPEPSSFVLTASGLAGLAWGRSRRRQRHVKS